MDSKSHSSNNQPASNQTMQTKKSTSSIQSNLRTPKQNYNCENMSMLDCNSSYQQNDTMSTSQMNKSAMLNRKNCSTNNVHSEAYNTNTIIKSQMPQRNRLIEQRLNGIKQGKQGDKSNTNHSISKKVTFKDDTSKKIHILSNNSGKTLLEPSPSGGEMSRLSENTSNVMFIKEKNKGSFLHKESNYNENEQYSQQSTRYFWDHFSLLIVCF